MGILYSEYVERNRVSVANGTAKHVIRETPHKKKLIRELKFATRIKTCENRFFFGTRVQHAYRNKTFTT